LALNDAVSSNVVRFGSEFELDFGAYELRRAGQSLKLARIPMELLLLLVAQRGQLVTREQIVERVWGKNVFLDTDNSINAVIRRIRLVLEDDPEQPRFIQTVIGRGYRFIAAIEEDSASPSVFSDAEQQLTELSTALGASAPRPIRSRLWIGAGVGILLVLGVVGLEFSGIRERFFPGTLSSDAPKPFKVRPSVAVLGFKNLSGKPDAAWISTALEEMFSAELAAGQQLRVVPSEDVDCMKLDLPLPATDSYGRDTLGNIRKRLNADVVVLGSYLATGDDAGGKIRIDLQLQDTRSGETIAVISRDGTASELADLVSHGGATLRQKLGIRDVSADDARLALASAPANLEAARLYAEGLGKLRNFEALAARDLLLKAVAADPKHALSHAALSECWATLGYDLKAQEEAKKAVDLSSGLSREDQLSIEGRYRVATQEWPRAVEIYRMLWEFFPDNLDYALALAKTQSSAGLGKDAMATVEVLSKRSLPAGVDPRIDLAEAVAADALGDFHREVMAATRAVKKGQLEGARALTARALLMRGSVLTALGDSESAVAALKEAQAVFSAVGDQQSVARVLSNLGIVQRHQSNLVEARKLQEESLQISRRIGNKLSMMKALNNLGNVLWDQGDMAGAVNAHQQSLNLSREIGAKADEASSLNNLGGLLTLQGKLAEAQEMYNQSLQLDHEAGDQDGAGNTLVNIADLLNRQGKLGAARKAAEEALAIDRQVGNKSIEGYSLYQLGSILVSQGDLAGGRKKYEEAVALRHELGEKVTEAESQFALAELQLDAGDASGSEAEARRLVTVFHAGSAIDDEALSYSLLALSLSKQGKWTEAEQASAKATELAPKALDLAARLQVEIDSAYVAVVLNSAVRSPRNSPSKAAVAARALEATREKANRFGYVGLELEARWRMAEVELQSGKVGAGRARLEQLRHDAQAREFLLIAHKATEALRTDSPSSAGLQALPRRLG
jgi:eukaryotic-like serine/threonine-protein kinase